MRRTLIPASSGIEPLTASDGYVGLLSFKVESRTEECSDPVVGKLALHNFVIILCSAKFTRDRFAVCFSRCTVPNDFALVSCMGLCS
jgi:hypothetical protein